MTFVPPKDSSRLTRRVRGKLLGARRRLRRMLRSGPARPLFVVGCGRSGTDLLVAALGQSVQVDLYNEDNPGAFAGWKLHPLPVIDALIESSRADVVVFKPIVETQRVGEFLERWPGASSIFVIRHPWNTIQSMVRFFPSMERATGKWAASEPADGGPSRASEEMHENFLELYHHASTLADHNAVAWWVRNAAFFALGLEKDGRVALSDYDDLMADPERVFQDMSDFAGVEYEPAMVQLVRPNAKPKVAPEIAPPILEACADLWDRLLAADVDRRLGRA